MASDDFPLEIESGLKMIWSGFVHYDCCVGYLLCVRALSLARSLV
jgi:hypothetical protein